MNIYCLFFQITIFLIFIPISEQTGPNNEKESDKVSLSSISTSSAEKKIKEFIEKFVNPLAEELKCKKMMKLNETNEIVMINGEMAENEHKIAICKQFLDIKKIKEKEEFENEFMDLVKYDLHNFKFYKGGESWAGNQEENWERIDDLKRIDQIEEIIKTSLPHLINRLDQRQSLIRKNLVKSKKELNKKALAQLAANISFALKILKGQIWISPERILTILMAELHIYAVEVEEIWQSGILKKWNWKKFPDFYE